MESLVKLYDCEDAEQMGVVGFMSGSGTNLIKIIERELELKQERGISPFHVALIFSDTFKSKANEIGAQFGIPVFTYDLEGFCRKNQANIKDMVARGEYEREAIRVINEFQCPIFAYAGYMRKATDIFVGSAIGVNVHPADLSILGHDGRRKYRGDKAVRDAIVAGEKEIRSTMHIVSPVVDDGPILMVSAPVQIGYDIPSDKEGRNSIANDYQDLLKRKGDWVIFPRTLEYLADGRFAKDEQGKLYLDGRAIPNGVRLEE